MRQLTEQQQRQIDMPYPAKVIYKYLDLGIANRKTVAKLINAADGKGLQVYMDQCIKKYDKQLTEVTMKEGQQMMLDLCSRWIEESYQEANGDKTETRKRIAKLQKIAEDLDIVEQMREAWRLKFPK